MGEIYSIWIQFSSVPQSCLTLCNSMNHSMPGLPVHHQLPESTQTHVHWVDDAIEPSYPLSSPFPPALIFPSIRVFSNESAIHIRWSKYWSFSFNISPSNEHLGLISFRMNWLDLLAVQGTLKSGKDWGAGFSDAGKDWGQEEKGFISICDMNIVTPAFFCSPFAWNIFFQLFTFSLCVSFVLR